MNYYAHYDEKKGLVQYLNEHLHNVTKMAEKTVTPTLHFQDINSQEIVEIIQNIALFHDLGKYTDFFQEYLIKGIDSDLKNHAHISACFLYWLILDQISPRLEKGDRFAWAFLAYLSVRFHHGSLSLKNLFSNEEMWERLKSQAENIKKKAENIYKDLALEERLDFRQFIEYFSVDRLKNDQRFFQYMPEYLMHGRLRNAQWYFVLLYLFSVLIDADKLDAARIQRGDRQIVEPDKVLTYLHTKHGAIDETELIQRRNRARSSMLASIDSLSKEQVKRNYFYTVTAPTGIGKTLSALQAALRLQKRIQEEEGYTPRLITAIPFINIIEQTKSDYDGVFGDEAKLITHHRFTDFTEYQQRSSEEKSLDQTMLEVESWEADVILTTFVQLFQSVLTGENRLLKKVNKLAGSIVILDEIQSIPDQFMPLIGALLRKVAYHYGTRFILMTATQPKILELGDLLLGSVENNPIELLPDHEQYFKGLERTRFVPLLEEVYNNEQFFSLLLNLWNQKESVLIVLNTIKRSIDIYNLLREKQDSGELSSDFELYYLSTNIVPKQRKEVIERVKSRLKKGVPLVMVSTQTIEAGVDLDFDIGFRDLAPLESLIQTAGRINREGKKGKHKPLYIVQIESDHKWIYSLHQLDRTKRLLRNYGEIKEAEYRGLVEMYYQELMQAGVSDESRLLWEKGVVGLDFDVLKKFQLIENVGQVVDVYVEMPNDTQSTLLLDAYEELKREEWEPYALTQVFSQEVISEYGNSPSYFERRSLLRILLSKMSSYMLQIRITRAKTNQPISFQARNGCEAPFYWIPPDQLSDYYHRETGYIDEGGGAYLW